jgi:hypothetical protein
MRTRHTSTCGLATLFLLLPCASTAQSWVEVRNENGILVQKQEDPSRVLPVLRATAEIAGPPERVLAWIRDVTTHPRWMADCVEAKSLKTTDEHTYAYNRVGAPWPVSDRDAVVKSKLIEKDGGFRVEFHDTEELGTPETPDVVRMAKVVGYWDLRPNGAGGTAVEYQVDSDPAGSLPGWLVARVASENPYNSVLNLKNLVESGKKP